VEWNRNLVGEPSGHPLKDARCAVYIGDVAQRVRETDGSFDAIMLDVDNGPSALIRLENEWLYSSAGLAAACKSLRPGGVLAVWSAVDDRRFTERLTKAGFEVDVQTVRPHRKGRGARHRIWFATPKF